MHFRIRKPRLKRLSEYLKPYRKYFHDPDIREFDMQHEQWLLGEKEYAEPVLKAIDEFMDMAVQGRFVEKSFQ